MGPVISKTNDYEEEKKGLPNEVSDLGAIIPKSETTEDTGGDILREKHLGKFNIKLKHILAYLKDGVPFGDNVDGNNLYSSMIEYNTKVRRTISSSDDYNEKKAI